MTLLFLVGSIAFSSQANAGFLFGYLVGSMTSGSPAKKQGSDSQQDILYEASLEVFKAIKDELSVRIVSKIFCPVVENKNEKSRFGQAAAPNRSIQELFQVATATSTPKTLLRVSSVVIPSGGAECATLWFYYINN